MRLCTVGTRVRAVLQPCGKHLYTLCKGPEIEVHSSAEVEYGFPS